MNKVLDKKYSYTLPKKSLSLASIFNWFILSNKDDKSLFKQFAPESIEHEPNNPFGDLFKELYGEEPTKKEEKQPESNNVVELKEYKDKLLRYQAAQRQQQMRNMLESEQQYEQQETHHRRAA